VTQGKMIFCEKFFRAFPIDKLFLKARWNVKSNLLANKRRTKRLSSAAFVTCMRTLSFVVAETALVLVEDGLK
jgi:hypothetical protein